MYTRVTRSESWLVGEKVIFVDELIDTAKDQFFKDFRANGLEGHWSVVIYYLFSICVSVCVCVCVCVCACVCTGIILPFFQSSWITPCWRQFFYIIDRVLVIFKLHNFSIHIKIPLWSWALCGFNPLINFKILPQSSLCVEQFICWKNAIVSIRLALLNKENC